MLLNHSNVEIVRHIASPGDGNLTYWSTRLGRSPELSNRVANLLKKQKGKCRECGLTFRNEDSWEVDHIKPLLLGGKDRWDNIQL
ncbi:MAG: HNH endonuclease [Hormoscilla sp. GUM202]|nr:HNH endonuclease [Hormoscilla sp. GUM202]